MMQENGYLEYLYVNVGAVTDQWQASIRVWVILQRDWFV